MDPLTNSDNIFHWKCGTKMEAKVTTGMAYYERSRLACCGCLHSFEGIVTYYECVTCSIPKPQHSRSSTDYPYRYCDSCATSANYELSSVNNACRAIYHPRHSCVCGGTLKPKLHDALQAIGHWSYMRDNISAPYRYIKLICNGCLEEIDTFSIYLSCNNNALCLMEHPNGFRYCLYCVEQCMHLLSTSLQSNDEDSSDEEDEDDDDEEEDDEEQESSTDQSNKNEDTKPEVPTSVTDCLLLLSRIHTLWRLSVNGFELDVSDEQLIQTDYCALVQEEMHRLMRRKEDEMKNAARLMTVNTTQENMEMFNDERFAVPLIYHVFGFCINHYMMVVRLGAVNKLFHSLLTFKGKQKNDTEVHYLSDIWKSVCFVQWPPLKDIIKHEVPKDIKRFKTRWDIYYRIRFDKLKQKHLEKHTKSWMTDIEDIQPFHYEKRKMHGWIANCEMDQGMEIKTEDEIWDKVLPDGYEWKVKCPLFMDKLKWKPNIGAYYCNVCDKNVYPLDFGSESFRETFQTYLNKKRCVAIAMDGCSDRTNGSNVMKWKRRWVKGEAAPFVLAESSEASE